MNRQFQNVVLTLSDDSVHVFTGHVMAYPGDTRSIRSVELTLPQDMPEGMAFEPMTGGEESHD